MQKEETKSLQIQKRVIPLYGLELTWIVYMNSQVQQERKSKFLEEPSSHLMPMGKLLSDILAVRLFVNQGEISNAILDIAHRHFNY